MRPPKGDDYKDARYMDNILGENVIYPKNISLGLTTINMEIED